SSWPRAAKTSRSTNSFNLAGSALASASPCKAWTSDVLAIVAVVFARYARFRRYLPEVSMPSQRMAGARPDAPALRTGAEFLHSLGDGRQIFLDGERVESVVKHPALRGAARSIAKLFDIAAAPELRERMTYPSPTTGAPVWRAWQIP